MKYYFLVICAFFFACSSKSSEKDSETVDIQINENDFTVEQAPEWTNLFLRKSGWFGGDGIFVIPYSGKDSEGSDSLLFLFSDTMIGNIDGEKLKPGSVMVNNSIAVLHDKVPDSSHISFKMAKAGEQYKAIFTPKTDKPNKDQYFWLGDGFVNPEAGKDMFIFAYKIQNTHDNSGFPFKEIGNTLIRIPCKSQFPYADQKHTDLPFNNYTGSEETISFGAGIFNNSESAGEIDGDGFVYVYGIKGVNKKLVAARVKPGEIDSFDRWEFWNAKSWANDVKGAAALSDSVSNEMSISRLSKNKYALVYQLSGIFPEICLRVGPTPVGPFGPRITLYKTTNDIKGPNLFTYNAKAHPALSAKGELLISYNVNSFKFLQDIEKMPDLYRPRFIRVKFKKKSLKQ